MARKLSQHYREPERSKRWKPKGYEKWLTLTELSRHVHKDKDWIRRLERDERIPKAKRVKHGEINVRLYSPEMVKEIEGIFSRMKPGRPAGA